MDSEQFDFYLREKEENDGEHCIKLWESSFKRLFSIKGRLEELSGDYVSMGQVVDGLLTAYDVEIDKLQLKED